ncbi:sodium channel protein Nach-like [Haematobia irritans]|uniref:sodium channel protein Nach-like n=1 Tax=Haematobia irritans TaxID=7368 RepID=UPI003F508002
MLCEMSHNIRWPTKTPKMVRPSWRITNDAIFKVHQTPNAKVTTTKPRAITTASPSLESTTTTTAITRKSSKTAETITTFIASYFKDGNIHGLKYVVKEDLTTIEKALWFALLNISMYCCVKTGLQSVDRYYTKSTVVGLERDFYYWNTTMPGVTICPLIRLHPQLFKEYSSQHNLNENESQELYNFLEHMANATYGNFNLIPNNRSVDLLLDRIGITPNLYQEIIYNLTGDHSFRTRESMKNMSDQIRSTTGETIIQSRQVLTEYGLCYMTNTLLSDKYTSTYMIWGQVPFNDIHDIPNILIVKKSSYFDSDVSYNFLGFGDKPMDGFLHSALEVMQLDHNLGYTNKPLQVDVECMEITTAEGFETGATVDQRKCRFQHESNLTHYPIYTRNICLQECRLNLVYKICKCIPHFYPNRIPNPKTVCDYRILLDCFVENEDFFIKMYKVNSEGERDSVECYCVQNCRDSIVNKRAKFHMEKTNDLVGGNSILFAMVNLPTYRLKRLIIFSFTDLLVSIGGTAGFFLGFSVLCLVEIIYYFTVRFLVYSIKECFNK